MQHVPPQSQARQHAGPEAFNQRIRRPAQVQQQFTSARMLQIDRQRSLAAIGGFKGRINPLPVAIRDMRRKVAHVVAGASVLDLDDIGAEVGEMQRCGRAWQQPRQVEDAQSGERGVGRHAIASSCVVTAIQLASSSSTRPASSPRRFSVTATSSACPA